MIRCGPISSLARTIASFCLIPEAPLDPSMPHEVEIQHEGAVIHNAGNDVYFVGSRGTWYPRTGTDPAAYDLTFRYPKALTVAATGKPFEDRIEGDQRITRLKTDTPIRFAGLTSGQFSIRRGGAQWIHDQSVCEPAFGECARFQSTSGAAHGSSGSNSACAAFHPSRGPCSATGSPSRPRAQDRRR